LGNLLYPGFDPGLFCRAFYPKTGLILSLSKDPLFGNGLEQILINLVRIQRL
jgi:hypothetical protein